MHKEYNRKRAIQVLTNNCQQVKKKKKSYPKTVKLALGSKYTKEQKEVSTLKLTKGK